MSPSMSPDDNPNANIPRQKRLACLICRRRKLKCDGRRPSCSTCSRLGHQCAYDEVRKKSGPKRGYVKALEERLKQVEVMLKSQDAGPAGASTADAPHGFTAGDARSAGLKAGPGAKTGENGSISKTGNERSGSSTTMGSSSGAGGAGDFSIPDPNSINLVGGTGRDLDTWQFNADSPQRPSSLDDFNFGSRMPGNMSGIDSNPTWEIIQLNLEEPLPDQRIIDELTEVYFEKIHPSLPMIHQARYLAAMDL